MTLDYAPLQRDLADVGYIADEALAMALCLMIGLGRPLLLEGEAGVGKTQIGKALAQVLKTRLIRLQCYEGLDANATIYEWNYQRQLLAIRAYERDAMPSDAIERHIFSEDYLLRRPLLEAISQPTSPVLLIDEIDRADEEFEVPPRNSLRIPDHCPGTRYHCRMLDTACDPDLEWDAGIVGRLTPPLPLQLSGLPRRGEGTRHSARPPAGSTIASPRRLFASCNCCGARIWRRAPA
jgi:hypothetical protein